MNRKEFFTKINGFVTAEERVKIEQAYWLAKEVHREQYRDGNGKRPNIFQVIKCLFYKIFLRDQFYGRERYFEHCRRVALYLIENGSTNANEIITALLHDCVEDGFMPKDLLERLFGREVAEAIDTLSKIIPVFDEETGAVKEKIKKPLGEYYQAIAESPVWIRRIKLADRLDNLKSMDVWPEKRKQKYIVETEKYILPIALVTDMQFYNELITELK